MGFLLIVLPIGSAQAGQVPAILNLLIPRTQNMDLKTSLCFITDAPSTVFSVRIGHTGKGCGIVKGLPLESLPKRSMTAPVVSVISAAIPLHNSLTPSRFLKRP